MILAICCKIQGVSTIDFLIIVNVNIWRGKGHYYYYNRPTEWIRRQHWGWWQDLSSPVVGCVAILLQEVVLKELGNLQSDFIGLSEGSLGNTHKWIEFKAFAPNTEFRIKSNLKYVVSSGFQGWVHTLPWGNARLELTFPTSCTISARSSSSCRISLAFVRRGTNSGKCLS